MDKLISKKTLLSSIRLSEGERFECDEKAILDAYVVQNENLSNLAIKILSIIGGFIAMLAFLGFLMLAGLYDSEFGLLIFGIIFIVTAIWLNKAYNKLIVDTFSVSLYVLGFTLLTFGLFEMDLSSNLIAVLVLLIALSSLFITQNFIISFISILTVSGSFLFLILFNQYYHLIHLYVALYTVALAFLFLKEAKLISLNTIISKLYNPLRIGLVFSLLFGLIILSNQFIIPISQNYLWISSIVIGLVVVYLVFTILKINEINALKSKVMIYALSAAILATTLFSPAILGAMIIILLSFLVNYKTGLVIGIISIIYFISQYYYDLSFTLLTKSIILFSSGILFLLLYLLTVKKFKN